MVTISNVFIKNMKNNVQKCTYTCNFWRFLGETKNTPFLDFIHIFALFNLKQPIIDWLAI